MTEEDTIRYYALHNIDIIKKEDATTFQIKNVCSELGEDNLCKIWETRPEICKNTKDKKCILKPEGCTD